MLNQPTTRRHLLRTAGIAAGAGLAASYLGACARKEGGSTPAAATVTDVTSQTQSGDTDQLTPELIDKAHETAVKQFPAKTEGEGGLPLEPKIDGDWKVFELTCKEVDWEVVPGVKLKAWTYNGMVPGPLLRFREGDKVRIVIKNELPESTSLHLHDLAIPNKFDGVTYVTTPPIKKGETQVYEFVATERLGTHMYHSHHNAYEQITRGLVGTIIVDPKDGRNYGETQDVILLVNDGALGFSINGKRFPATKPIIAKKGERLRLRLINAGQLYHPFHLHGLPMKIVEMDGFPLANPYLCDTISLNPGNRYDAIVEADKPGIWAFHCHVLTHAESPQGMHGMVTAVIVQE